MYHIRTKYPCIGKQSGESVEDIEMDSEPGREAGDQRVMVSSVTRSSAMAERPRDASCQLKSCQLPRNSAESTYTTSPDQIVGMKLEI